MAANYTVLETAWKAAKPEYRQFLPVATKEALKARAKAVTR